MSTSARRIFVEQVVEQSELITIAEAAKRLGITEDAVRKRIKKGTLQGRRENNKLMMDCF
jgi:phage antirepressor YoqD-like protein